MPDKKIAFLFLVIDNPHFPDIWDKYFHDHTNNISIYIHPKYPEKHTWKPQNIISNLQPTGWGYITAAYYELLQAAYQDKDNYKFITISESCVPVKPFSSLYNDITNDNLSWIKCMDTNIYSLLSKKKHVSNYDIEERIKKALTTQNNPHAPPLHHFFKHYARFAINRQHTKKILDSKDKMTFFNNMHVGDEFFLTVLYPLDNYKNFAITFDDWDYVKKEVKYLNNVINECYYFLEKYNIDKYKKIIETINSIKNNIRKNPKTITIINDDDYNNIKKTTSYFYRKFSKNSNINDYIDEFI